jgi:biopolymer transport protein ExbB
MLFAARPAMAWWNSDWAYRQSITIDTGANGAHLQDRALTFR